jgi:plasmid stabilization system protein ParE
MRIDWSESALTDLDGVEAYFGQYNLGAAVAAVDRITECVDLLESFPRWAT